MSDGSIVITLIIIFFANSNLFSFTLNNDNWIFFFLPVFLCLPDYNICTSRACSTPCIVYLYLLIHLLQIIAITIQQSANVSLTNFLFRLYYQPLIFKWSVYLIIFNLYFHITYCLLDILSDSLRMLFYFFGFSTTIYLAPLFTRIFQLYGQLLYKYKYCSAIVWSFVSSYDSIVRQTRVKYLSFSSSSSSTQ